MQSHTHLPSLTQTVAALSANKKFGQNFLIDESLCYRIASAIPEAAHIREIGPGPGGLTRALLALGHQIEAIEIDPIMVQALQPLQQAAGGRLSIRQENALHMPPPQQPTYMVGNLPFYIATELWLQWLRAPQHIAGMVLMFQSEVAERLIAIPNSKAYGRLGIVSQFLFDIEPILSVAAHQFHPPPKVDAMVIRAMPKIDLLQRLPEFNRLNRMATCAFAHRRKTLGTNIRKIIPDHLNVLATLGIDAKQRPEQIPPSDLRALAALLPD